MTNEVSPSELGYQEAMDELEAIVEALDEGAVDVDTLGDRFQRAIALVEELDARILRTKEQVDQLVPRLDRLRNGEAAD